MSSNNRVLPFFNGSPKISSQVFSTSSSVFAKLNFSFQGLWYLFGNKCKAFADLLDMTFVYMIHESCNLME